VELGDDDEESSEDIEGDEEADDLFEVGATVEDNGMEIKVEAFNL